MSCNALGLVVTSKICRAGSNSSASHTTEGCFFPGHGWVEMIREVYKIAPMVRPTCRCQMSIITFITYYPSVARIGKHVGKMTPLTSARISTRR